MAVVAALVAGAVGAPPPTASAATGSEGPEGTVHAFLAALRSRDAPRMCGLVDPTSFGDARTCRSAVAVDLPKVGRLRAGRVLARGGHARTVVELVELKGGYDLPQVSRNRVLLRRSGKRWLITQAGRLAGIADFSRGSAIDPTPTGRAAALRRLADDELLALSGSAGLLCGLLAPGAPLGGRDGACARFALETPTATVGPDHYERTLSIAGFAAHALGPDRARLDLAISVRHATRVRRRPGWALVATRWRDTLFAVRSGGRWRLVKPSASFYRVAGEPLPSDVASPSASATWPTGDAVLPSLSELPLRAACRVPPGLWPATCRGVDALSAAPRPGGGGLVGWSAGFASQWRPVAAGLATAPATAPEAKPPASLDELWQLADHGVVSVAGGALAIEASQTRLSVRAIPLDPDGRPRGPVQTVDQGVENTDDGTEPLVAVGPPGAATATLVTNDTTIVHVDADGRRVGPDVPLRTDVFTSDSRTAVALPDGGLLAVEPTDSGVGIRRIGPDGRSLGPEVSQLAEGQASLGDDEIGAAIDADGRTLVAWGEEDSPGHAAVRTWLYDPREPLRTTPATVARYRLRPPQDALGVVDARPRVEVAALPGGAWGLAYAYGAGTGAAGLRAVRLDAAGSPTAPPRRVADPPGSTAYVGNGFGIAGDTVAWIARPRVAGIPQVRSAPLP